MRADDRCCPLVGVKLNNSIQIIEHNNRAEWRLQQFKLLLRLVAHERQKQLKRARNVSFVGLSVGLSLQVDGRRMRSTLFMTVSCFVNDKQAVSETNTQ